MFRQRARDGGLFSTSSSDDSDASTRRPSTFIFESSSDDTSLSSDADVGEQELRNAFLKVAEPWRFAGEASAPRTRSMKSRFTIQDRLTSPFYKKWIQPAGVAMGDNDITSPNTGAGKEFRKCFRVPYQIFLSICDEIALLGYVQKSDCTGAEPIELKLLVLGSLRILAHGMPFDALEDCTMVGQETHRQFFKFTFLPWGEAKCHKVVKLPSTEEEVQHVVDFYKKLGHPGCVGSIDCVHVRWDLCPAGALTVCKGKEKVPTLAFEVVVSHTRKILSVCGSFYGTNNDKMMAHNDAAVSTLRESNGFLSNYVWECFDIYGNIRQRRGLYYICDGGYHTWPCLIPPYKDQLIESDMGQWSAHLESLRKDVECTFGILKKRFLILKNAIRFESRNHVAQVFFTCCALHNILLDFDGRDDWNNADSMEFEMDTYPVEGSDIASDNPRDETVGTVENHGVNNNANTSDFQAFRRRRDELIEHFTYGVCEGLFPSFARS